MGVGVLFVSVLGEVLDFVSISVLGVAVCGLGEVLIYVVVRVLGVTVLANVIINGGVCVLFKCLC